MGKLEVIWEPKIVKHSQDPGFYEIRSYGLEDSELGIVFECSQYINDIQILDDNNVFVWAYENGESREGIMMNHYQREKDKLGEEKFVKKYRFQASSFFIGKIERISIDNVIIILSNKVTFTKSIYSLVQCRELSIGLDEISEFFGPEEERIARVRVAITEKEPYNNRRDNFLYGTIDENGNYVTNFFDIYENMYDITSEEYQEGGNFSIEKLIGILKKREEALNIEGQRLDYTYFSSNKI